MRQFVQLWVCRYLSTGSFISLTISPVGYASTFSPARAVGFLFVPPSPLPPKLPPLVWLLNSGENVIWRFRIKCAICFKKKKNSNKKKGIRAIAPFIFYEEDGRVRKDHPAWLKIPKSPTVWYCCTLGNRLALGQLKIMSKLNGASTVQVRGCVEVWVLRLFVPNRKEKKDRARLHEAKWQHQYMWQSIVMTWANLQKARVVRGHLSEDRQLRHGSGVHWEHRGSCVQREGRGRGGRESERERWRYKYFVVTLSRSLEGQIIHEACLARESPPSWIPS